MLYKILLILHCFIFPTACCTSHHTVCHIIWFRMVGTPIHFHYIICKLLRTIYLKVVYKVQITQMNFIHAALDMQLRFIPKQAFHTILDAIISTFKASSHYLCPVPAAFPLDCLGISSVSFLYILHITETPRQVFGPRQSALEELHF